MTQRSLYRETLLHTEAFTHRSFYPHTRFYSQKFLHGEVFAERSTESFYAQKLLHRDSGKSLHRRAFTHRLVSTQKLLHTGACTQRSFSTEKPFHIFDTEELLHTETFTQRSLYTGTLLHTQTRLHTKTFTQRSFYLDFVREACIEGFKIATLDQFVMSGSHFERNGCIWSCTPAILRQFLDISLWRCKITILLQFLPFRGLRFVSHRLAAPAAKRKKFRTWAGVL